MRFALLTVLTLLPGCSASETAEQWITGNGGIAVAGTFVPKEEIPGLALELGELLREKGFAACEKPDIPDHWNTGTEHLTVDWFHKSLPADGDIYVSVSHSEQHMTLGAGTTGRPSGDSAAVRQHLDETDRLILDWWRSKGLPVASDDSSRELDQEH